MANGSPCCLGRGGVPGRHRPRRAGPRRSRLFHTNGRRPAGARADGLFVRHRRRRRWRDDLGGAGYAGDTLGVPLQKPIVGGATDPAGGYSLVASDGGIFAFGGAAFYGSTGGIALNKPIVGMAATPAAAATGWWPPTAASSPATRRSKAPPGASRSTSPSSAWRPRPTATATGWWPPTAASSPSATRHSTGRRGA